MKVLVTGGGTAGHINPAIAIAKKILENHPEAQIVYGGTPGGMESELAQREGFPYVAIEVKGFKRKLSVETFKTIAVLFKGLKQAWSVLKKEAPDIVIGTGGYVCGPLVLMAALQKRKTMIHEQNVIPGATNKILSRYVDTVCISYEASKEQFKKAKKVVLAGNPVKPEFINLDRNNCRVKLGVPKDAFLVVSTGGSGGAGAINSIVKEIFLDQESVKDLYWIHVTGRNYYAAFVEGFESSERDQRVKVLPFTHEMAILLGAADLSVSRAGALTLAELATVGVPGILIPSPNVANRHQDYNAEVCQKAGMAKIIHEKNLTAHLLVRTIETMRNNLEVLDEMRTKAHGLTMENAAQKIYDEIMELKER